MLDGNNPRSRWTRAIQPQAKLRAHRQHSATGLDRNTLQNEPPAALLLNQRRLDPVPSGIRPDQIFNHHGGSEATRQAALELVGQLAPGKPVWINEVGCGDQCGDKSRWITDFIGWLAGTDARGMIWFEVDGNLGAPDWRLTSSAATAAAAKAALASWQRG